MRRVPRHVLLVCGAACASLSPGARAQPLLSAQERAAQQASQDGPVVVGESRGKWDWFDLQRLQAALEFQGRHRVNKRSQSGQPTINDRESVLREFVELTGEAAIGHKNLVDLTGTVRLGLEDRFLDFDSVQASDHSSDFTNLYDLNAHVLGASSVPLDIFAKREEQLLDRDFAASVTNTVSEYGIAASIRSAVAPTTVRLSHHESKLDDPTGDFDYSQEQDTLSVRSNISLSKSNRLDAEYTFDDVTDRRGTSYVHPYQRHNLAFTDVYTFGKGDPDELRSYLRYYEETGPLGQRSLRWDEHLTLHHSRRLETRYKLSTDRKSVQGLDQDNLDASATIKHRLFQSLVSTGTIGAKRFSDSTSFSSNERYAEGTLDYTKEVPKGRLDITLGASFNNQDNSARGAGVRILDEPQVYNDPLPITLARRHIVAGSVEVSAEGGFPIYQEGTHYTVQYFPDRAEIRILLGSGISNGDVLLIDYDIGPEPASTVDTTGSSLSVRYSITEGWLDGLSAYGIWRSTDHSVESADAASLIFDDTTTLTYGLEFRRDDWHLRAEREHHESTVTPYDASRLEGSYTRLLESGATLGVDASYETIGYENPANTVDFSRISLRWNQDLSPSTEFIGRIDLRDERNDLSGDSRGLDAELTLRWKRRQTTAYVTLRQTLVEAGASDTSEQLIEVGFRREF